MATAGRTEKISLNDTKMLTSQRAGLHATVYEVRRDPDLKNKDVIRDRTKPVFPFIGGSQYKGQWNSDKKEGFGVQVNPDNTKYEGEWANNKYHGRGTLWVKKGKEFTRQYVGDWVDGRMEGQGIYYYDKVEIYKGEWMDGRRHGSGRFEHANGDVYFGEWKNDAPDGLGTMNYANGNIFEGLFLNGKKEGPGMYYYASTKKIYEGEWMDDNPRCGEFRSPNATEELKFVRPLPKGLFQNNFSLPQIGLANSKEVLEMAISSTRIKSVERTLSRPHTSMTVIQEHDLARAKQKFQEIAGDKSSIPISYMGEVIREMGMFVEQEDLHDLQQSLEEKQSLGLTFADICEIATFIQSEVNNRLERSNPFQY